MCNEDCKLRIVKKTCGCIMHNYIYRNKIGGTVCDHNQTVSCVQGEHCRTSTIIELHLTSFFNIYLVWIIWTWFMWIFLRLFFSKCVSNLQMKSTWMIFSPRERTVLEDLPSRMHRRVSRRCLQGNAIHLEANLFRRKWVSYVDQWTFNSAMNLSIWTDLKFFAFQTE